MKKVYEAISRVSAELSKHGVAKSQQNTFHKYKFRGIDDVMNAISHLLPANKLVIIPSVKCHKSTPMETKKGEMQLHTIAECNFHFASLEDDSTHDAVYVGESLDTGDKGTNKAMSAAYKYMALQTFCIPIEGMDDADQHSPEVGKQPAKQMNPEAINSVKQQAPKQEAKPATKPGPPAAGSPEEKQQLQDTCAAQAERLQFGPKFAEVGMEIETWADWTAEGSGLDTFISKLPNRLRASATSYFRFLYWRMLIVATGPGRPQMELRRQIDDDLLIGDSAKMRLKTESEQAEEVML